MFLHMGRLFAVSTTDDSQNGLTAVDAKDACRSGLSALMIQLANYSSHCLIAW